MEKAIEKMQNIKRRERNLVVFNIDSCQRLGNVRNDGKPRPLRITVKSFGHKSDIPKNAKTLRNNNIFAKVYVKPAGPHTSSAKTAERAFYESTKLANANGRRVRIFRGKLVPLVERPAPLSRTRSRATHPD